MEDLVHCVEMLEGVREQANGIVGVRIGFIHVVEVVIFETSVRGICSALI